MKLLKSGSCQREPDGGNVKTLTALGETRIDISSDRGSTPLASTSLAHNRTLFGLAVSVYFFNRLLHWVENRSQSNIIKYSHVLPCEQGPL